LPGEVAVSRIGLSILSTSGLTEFIAQSEDDFVRRAADLAGDLPRLAQCRRTMRQRMKASAFMDAPRLTRHVELACRERWRRWCARPV
jgi:predicted O-linked N-acetylglucosamine transferase (SPINDLY family)